MPGVVLRARGGGGSAWTDASDTLDAPDRVYVPHELPDAPGLDRILRALARRAGEPRAAASADASATATASDGGQEKRASEPKPGARTRRGRPVLCHGADLPAGLPSALASLARANAAEAARKAAEAAEAAESLAATLGAARRDPGSLVVEGIDVSHLAGANTSASVVVFVDGEAAPERHRRYAIETDPAGRASGDAVAPGDDPAAVRAAMGKRIAAAKRAVSGKRAASAAAAAAETGVRVPGALPDLALIDGGAAQLVAAARACLEAGVKVINARGAAAGAADSDDATAEPSTPADPTRPYPFAIALASLAKGRVSGEESVFVPRAVVDDAGNVVDFTADRLVLGPGVAATRAGKAGAADGPGVRLLRAVRDESHAVALGAQRQRRRASLFQEMRSARDDEQSEASVATG